MLYDKKWDNRVNVHSIDSLIAWLQKQDAQKTYFYSDTKHCLLAQYYDAMGFDRPFVASDGWFIHGPNSERVRERYPDDFDAISSGKCTFGAALRLAEDFKRKLENA